MAVAAVPRYINQDFFTETPPGHRFGLYFQLWNPTDWCREPDSKDDKNKGKQGAIRRITYLGNEVKEMMRHIIARQKSLADAIGDSIWKLSAPSISPFMTGTGMEHPLENGFAFLNPYGAPYLPGSGIKGILRRAAEELVCGACGDDAHGWDQGIVTALFGYEPQSGEQYVTRNQGALMFWDVFPKCDRLAVDIMTPHYGDYYQGNATPHDSGQPNPILFLTVPPGSSFTFHVQCNLALLPKALRDSWQILLEAAFRHTFDWLGFGAKTAVGYGQFPSNAIEIARLERDEAERQAQLTAIAAAEARAEAALSNGQRAIRDLKQWLEEDQNAKRKEPGGRLSNRLNELFKDALAWSAAERENLATLAEAIYGYLDWGSGKKKQERKAKIQQLRASSP